MNIYRGDKFEGTISFNNYTLQVGDKVNIGVKYSTEQTPYVLHSQIDILAESTTVDFDFASAETHDLTVGDYIFEAELIYADGEHETVVQEALTVKGDVCR